MGVSAGSPGGTASAPKAATAPAGKRRFHFEGPDLFRQAARDAGWPIATLAAAGLVWLIRERRRDRLAALVVSLELVGLAFLTAGTLAPIREGMHQDVWEFLGRVNMATSPATAMLAAAGAAWCWRSGVIGRVAAAALVASALWPAAGAIERWFG
jgi:hypothetical protein